VSRERNPFWLVQRMSASPYAVQKESTGPLSGVTSNPFGYGRMGDYELDYMGAAEFEFGEIPKANNRLADAGKDLVLDEFSFKGHTFDRLYIGREGDPTDEWIDWAEGRHVDPYNGETYKARPFDGKERPYELERRLDGEEPFGDEGWRTAIWWALKGNVLWAFKEDGHLLRWIESMAASPTEFLR
jgi:hypothetical protein